MAKAKELRTLFVWNDSKQVVATFPDRPADGGRSVECFQLGHGFLSCGIGWMMTRPVVQLTRDYTSTLEELSMCVDESIEVVIPDRRREVLLDAIRVRAAVTIKQGADQIDAMISGGDHG